MWRIIFYDNVTLLNISNIFINILKISASLLPNKISLKWGTCITLFFARLLIPEFQFISCWWSLLFEIKMTIHWRWTWVIWINIIKGQLIPIKKITVNLAISEVRALWENTCVLELQLLYEVSFRYWFATQCIKYLWTILHF